MSTEAISPSSRERTVRRSRTSRKRRMRPGSPRCPKVEDDDGAAQRAAVDRLVGEFALQGRQDSNLQPPVLETGALPVELLPSAAAFYPGSFSRLAVVAAPRRRSL